MGRTTIQIKESTKDDLDDLKRVPGESFDSVVKMLVAKHTQEVSDTLTDAQRGEVREIALDVVNQRVIREALE